MIRRLIMSSRKHPNNGFYILDIDGDYYTGDEWDTANNNKAVGIAFLHPKCNYCVHPQAEKNHVEYAPKDKTIFTDLCFTTMSGPTASTDYNGIFNTKGIVDKIGANGEAAYYCYNTTFKNGKQGYLGAAGELILLAGQMEILNPLLQKIGGKAMLGRYLVSTQRDNDTLFYVYFQNGNIYLLHDNLRGKDTTNELNFIARPFAPL